MFFHTALARYDYNKSNLRFLVVFLMLFASTPPNALIYLFKHISMMWSELAEIFRAPINTSSPL